MKHIPSPPAQLDCTLFLCSSAPLLVRLASHFLLHLHSCSFYSKGESDSMGVHRAQTYYERFETLVNDIRGLGYPDLKFFSVAVTGSIPSRLPFLQQVGWAFVLTLFVLPSFANPPPDALSVMAAVAQPRDVDCTETRLFGAPFGPTRFAMCSSGQALQRGSPACGSRMHSVCPCPRTVCICSPTHRYVCMHTPCLIFT